VVSLAVDVLEEDPLEEVEVEPEALAEEVEVELLSKSKASDVSLTETMLVAKKVL